MNINGLLNGKHCFCGQFHTCDIESVFIEDGAIGRLEGLCAEYKNILLVADENTFTAAGEETCRVLGKKIANIILQNLNIL